MPDLTRVKSGRACLPLCRRVPRPPRQARPDYWRQAWGGPLACGLAPFGNRTAKTLPRSVFGRSSGGDLPGGVSPRLQRGICRPQFFGVFLRHCARAHPGRPLPPRPARRATLDPDRPPVDLKWLDSGGAADEAGSCSSPNMMLCHRLRCLMAPPSFLPDLTRVKSGRACDPAAPRARRSSRKSSTGRFLIAHHPLGRRVAAPAQAGAAGLPPSGLGHAPCLRACALRQSDRKNAPPERFQAVLWTLRAGGCRRVFAGRRSSMSSSVYMRGHLRGRPLPRHSTRRAALDPDRLLVDLKLLHVGKGADELDSSVFPRMLIHRFLSWQMSLSIPLAGLRASGLGRAPCLRACALRQSGRKNAPPERFQAVLWGRSGYTPAGRAE